MATHKSEPPHVTVHAIYDRLCHLNDVCMALCMTWAVLLIVSLVLMGICPRRHVCVLLLVLLLYSHTHNIIMPMLSLTMLSHVHVTVTMFMLSCLCHNVYLTMFVSVWLYQYGCIPIFVS